MAPDQRPAPLNKNQALINQARALIKQRRWLDAEDVLCAALRQSPSDMVLRAEQARVQLALGNPAAALQLLAPCSEQAITNTNLNGLIWRTRVRAAESSAQAAQQVREALSSGPPLPEHVVEEWRMISNGLVQAGWHQQAAAWHMALGPLAEGLDLAPLWSQRPAPTAHDPDLDLDRLSTQMVLHPAAELQRNAQAFNQAICQAWLEALPPQLPPRPGPRRRWLLCANDSLPQCWLYRVEQKRQQLRSLGCQASLLSLKALQAAASIPELLQDIDGLLIHRLPASQVLFALIAAARRQGIPVLFDLDDLLFDPEHAPPPLANYGGSIRPEWHRTVVATLPQIQTSLHAADQLLFSTRTLADRWAAVQASDDNATTPLQLWPNLIPDALQRNQRRPRLRQLRQRRGRLRLVVASASTPHRLIWHQQLAPALAQLLEQHPQLRLDLLGDLPLPLVLEPFQARIRCRGHCPFPDYLRRLGEADIGLMVLEPGPFTDAKSPNRWMECSLMGVATVLSPIRSCRDLLQEGEHTLFAENQQAWVDQINRLIAHPQQRLAMAERAQRHALDQLGSDRAAELWAPLLQLEQPPPTQRMALIVDEDKPTAIQGEARLANALARALRQHPQRRLDWYAGNDQTAITRWCQSWQHTPPDLLHITGTGASAQTAIDLAIERKIPYVLHLHDRRWLQPSQRSRLQQAAGCTVPSAQLLNATRSTGQQTVTLIEWPWQAFPPTRRGTPTSGPLRALVPRHPQQDSGLLALKAAIEQLPPDSLELTVLDGTPTPLQPGDQRWGGCRVRWRSQPNRAELGDLLQTHSLWLEPALGGGDDPALTREVLSAGLQVLASDASTTAELLKRPKHTDWLSQLRGALGQSDPPLPLLQFPATRPDLATVLEQIHRQIRPGLTAESRYSEHGSGS